VKLFEGQGEVPVLIDSWTEEQEKRILATLDPLAALAGADSDALDKLLGEIDTGSEALQIRDAVREVGWAGALLYNERTNRLIDGHACDIHVIDMPDGLDFTAGVRSWGSWRWRRLENS
jgi:hypothetical protein